MAKDIFGDDDSSTGKRDDFGAMLEASLAGMNVQFTKGDRVSAEIVTIGKDDVFVTVKGKDGVISKVELLDDQGKIKYQVGEQLDLYVVRTKDDLVLLTAKPSSKAISETLEDAFDFETPVDGKVTEAVNGGFRVSVHGKLAFCPISQMDIKPITDNEAYIGKKFEFIITKFEGGGKNIVVSRRRLLDQERLENQGAFLEKTKVGAILPGQVVRLENYGAFVKLAEGVDGLVHISEVAWSRISHPSEALQLNQSVSVKVLKMDEDDQGRVKISLSIKQSGDDPWVAGSSNIKVGSAIMGKIKEKERFGFLIELAPGVVGLLPKGAIRESMDSDLESKKIGESIRVVVNSINPSDKRISLTLPREQEEYSSAALGQSTGFGTLGDQFKDLMKKK